MQTRAAMAIHLAHKLKIDPNEDPMQIFAQYQKLVADLDAAPVNNYWEKEIEIGREKTLINKARRIKRITSSGFLQDQQTIKEHV